MWVCISRMQKKIREVWHAHIPHLYISRQAPGSITIPFAYLYPISCSCCTWRSRLGDIDLIASRTSAAALENVRASEQATWDECRVALEQQLVEASIRSILYADIKLLMG